MKLLDSARAALGGGGGRIANAVGWTTFAHLAGQIIRIAGQLVLARLLAPEMFGVMSIIAVIQIVLALLTDVGLRPTVIQSKRGDDPAFLNTVWTLQVIRGGLIWAINLAIAAGLAAATATGLMLPGSAWAAPELPVVLAIASVSALIAGFQSTNLISANRHLNLQRVVLIELIAQVVSLAVMIILSVFYQSIWPLVVGWIVSTVVTTFLSHYWLDGIANSFAWDRASLTELYNFGGWVLVSSILFVAATNMDRLLLAALVSPATIGLYSIALNLVLIVDGIGSRILGNVALPALSEIARTDPARFRQSIQRMRRPLDALLLAASGVLFAMGQSLVDLFYDSRYREAGAILQILSLSLIFIRYNLFTTVYLALGEPKWTAVVNLAKLAALVILVSLLYVTYGFHGAVYGVALHGALILPLIYVLNERHRLNDLKFEVTILVMWGVGYALGCIGVLIIRRLLG